MLNIAKYKSYPWVVVAMLWFVALLNYLDRQMLSTMQKFMEVDIQALADAANFGRLMAIFLWIYALMSPVSGMIADRLNRKWLIVISLFVWSGVTFAMSYVSDLKAWGDAFFAAVGIGDSVNLDEFSYLYGLRAIMGISEAFYVPAGLALLADYHQGKTRSLAIGFHTTGIYLGQALGGFGAPLAEATSWQFTFHSFGLLGMVYSVVLILFLKEKKTYTLSTQEKKSLFDNVKVACQGLAMLFGNIAFWVILFFFATPSLPGWVTKNWLPTIFSGSLHMEMSKAGPISTMTLALASLVGVLIGGWLSDRWVQKTFKGRIYTSAIGIGLLIPGILLIGYVYAAGNGTLPESLCLGANASIALAVAGALTFGLGFGMYDVNNMPILCQFVPSRYRATGYGLMNLAGISAGAVITEKFGEAVKAGYTDIIFVVMVAGVIAAVLLQLLVLRPKTANMTDELLAASRGK